MRKVLEYNVTPPDGTIKTGNELVKGVFKSIAGEKDFKVDELVVKVNDVYSAVKLKGSFNNIGTNNVIQINRGTS